MFTIRASEVDRPDGHFFGLSSLWFHCVSPKSPGGILVLALTSLVFCKNCQEKKMNRSVLAKSPARLGILGYQTNSSL